MVLEFLRGMFVVVKGKKKIVYRTNWLRKSMQNLSELHFV